MKLTVTSRIAGKKTENKQIRRQGNIPAVLYSKGEKGQEIVVDGIAFKKILNTTPTGTLSSKIFKIDIEGKTVQAIVKDIQYNITTYEVIHLDFEQLHDKHPISVKIPVRCVNVADCVGVKLGGVVRLLVRQVPVVCFPENIPEDFEVDVRDLAVGQMMKLSDLKIPHGVRPTIDLNQAAVVIAKK